MFAVSFPCLLAKHQTFWKLKIHSDSIAHIVSQKQTTKQEIVLNSSFSLFMTEGNNNASSFLISCVYAAITQLFGNHLEKILCKTFLFARM